MKTLGTATKAAIARLVNVLPYLRSEEAAVPTAHRSFWSEIKARYAQKPGGGNSPSDPLQDAALAHAEEQIAAALEEDEKGEVKAADETAEQLPVPNEPIVEAPVVETTPEVLP